MVVSTKEVDARMLVALCPFQPNAQKAGVAQWHLEHLPQHLYLYKAGETGALGQAREMLLTQLNDLVIQIPEAGTILTVVVLFYDNNGQRAGNIFEFSWAIEPQEVLDATVQDVINLLVRRTMESMTGWIHAYRDLAAGYDY